MAQLDFSRVRAVVADDSRLVRQAVRNTLYNMGFREISDTGQLATAHEMCQENLVDLLVINSDFGSSDSCYLVREIRRTRLGNDPFTVVVSLLPMADQDHVRKVVDSGSDDLLLIPFAPDQLSSRLLSVITRRKPFVVTHDYVGPDRRKQARPGSNSTAFQFAPPNPVAARAGGVPPERYRKLVQDAVDEIRRRRVGCLAGYVRREGRELLATGRDGQPVPEDLAGRLFRLESAAEELSGIEPTVLDLGELSRACASVRDWGSFTEIERLHAQTEAIAARYGAVG